MSHDQMTEYRDWNIQLTFNVPPGDTDGVMTDAILDAALEHGPSQAAGVVASASTHEGKVWIMFTLVDSSRGLADEVANAMRLRVLETVFSGDDASVSLAL